MISDLYLENGSKNQKTSPWAGFATRLPEYLLSGLFFENFIADRQRPHWVFRSMSPTYSIYKHYIKKGQLNQVGDYLSYINMTFYANQESTSLLVKHRRWKIWRKYTKFQI
jgi:hypothetical protein